MAELAEANPVAAALDIVVLIVVTRELMMV